MGSSFARLFKAVVPDDSRNGGQSVNPTNRRRLEWDHDLGYDPKC